MEETKGFDFQRLLIWLPVLIIAILLLVSISIAPQKIIEDHIRIEQDRNGFIDIIRGHFPDLENPIGPFGAFMSYWLNFIFGRILCISLLVSLIMLSVFKLFIIIKGNIIGRLVCFVLMCFFLNIIILTLTGKHPEIPGLITASVRTLLNRFFSTTGTIIIAGIITVIMMIFTFEPINIWKFLVWVYNLLKSLLKLIFSGKKTKSVPSKKPEKTSKKPKLKIHTEKEEEKEPEEQIDIEIPEKKGNKRQKPKKPPINQNPPKREESSVPSPRKRNPESNFKPPEDGKYKLPDISEFLQESTSLISDRKALEDDIAQISSILQNKLAEFQVEATVKNVNIGPIVTQYELKPAPGIKVNTFSNLSKDLALALKAKSLRVEAPIPGKGLIGIEIPNKQRDIIFLKDIMLSTQMKKKKSKLAIALGKDISGNPVVEDLSRMPHLLIAGATGSGKSVCVNSIIISLLLRAKPSELRLILIDPKRIELAGYEGIPHLIQNVVTEPDHVMIALNWAVSEMERRYKLLQNFNVRNLEDFNNKIKELRQIGEEPEENKLPFIVLIIDEFSDLIMTATKEIERPVTRLAQMARAIGIHLILATQRPSTKVITGLIKANFPSRIAFKVSQRINSRVILDTNGAEQLLGKGDSLFLGPGKAIPERIHGAYVSDEEINKLVDYLRVQPKPENDIEIIKEDSYTLEEFDYDDPLFPEAAYAVVSAGAASVSMLQRHFKIGYARAGRLIDLLEQANIVGPHLGSKSREVVASEEDLRIYGYLPEEKL